MANPTVTIEIKEIGSGPVIERLRLVRQEAGKLVGAKKRLARGSKSLEVAQRSATRAVGNLGTGFRNLGSAAIFAVGPLSGFGARLVAFSAIAERTSVKVAAFAAGMAAAVVGMVKLISASIRASLEFQKIESALTVATGSLFGAKDAFEFVTEVSLDLGLSLKESAGQFAQLAAAAKGTSLEGEGVRKVFLGTAKAAVALGLSVDQVTGIFRALQQMISKGTVQAEELRGQLGERLPGAFQIAAVAMKTTTAELGRMLKRGEVMAEELLPKLGEEFEKRFGRQALIASENLQASLNRLSTATFLFSLELDNTIKSGTFAAGVLDDLSSATLALKNNMSALISIVGSIGVGFALMAAPATIRGLIKLVMWTKRLTVGVFALGVAISSTPVGFAITLARIAVAAAGGAIAFFAFRDSLDKAAVSQAGLIVQLKEYIDIVNEAEGATRAAIDAQIALAEKGIKAIQIEIQALSAILKALPQPELRGLTPLEEFLTFTPVIRDITTFFKSLGADESAGVAKERIKGLAAEMQELLTLIENLRDLPVVKLEDDKASKILDKILLEVDALERLNTARKRGEDVRLEILFQLDFETTLRKANTSALTKEGIAILAALRAKQKAIAVSDALTEAEEKSFRAAKRIEVLRDKIDKQRVTGAASIEALEKSNAVLRLRIDGLFEEARAMEIRNALEEQYNKNGLPNTIEALIRLQLEHDRLIDKLNEVNEFELILEDGFRDLGSTIVDIISEGTNAWEAFLNVIKRTLEAVLDLAIQLFIIEPILRSIKTAGGGGGLLDFLGLSTLFAGGPGPGAGPPIRLSHGGEFTVGGRGGIDSNLIPLALTRGEKVKVTPVGGENGSAPSNTYIFNLPESMTAKEFGESRAQIMAMVASAAAAASASNN